MASQLLEAPIRAVIFDLMDTLVYDPIHYEVSAFFGLTKAEFFAAVDHALYMDFERGRVDRAGLYAGFFRDGRRIDAVAFETHLRASFRWVDGVEDLLYALQRRGQVELCLLSNYSCWYELVDAQLKLQRFFPPHRTILSYRIGVRKPETQAFQAACDALGLPPVQCLFVDDRASNCAAAQELGMRTAVCRTAADLRNALFAAGLLPATAALSAAPTRGSDLTAVL